MSKYTVLKLSFIVSTVLAATSASAQSGAVAVIHSPSDTTTLTAERVLIDDNAKVVEQSDPVAAVASGNVVQITAEQVTFNTDGSVVWTGNPRLSQLVQPKVTVITSDGAPISLTEAQSLSNNRQIERVEMPKGAGVINIVRTR
jgi:flagellar biosynthesis/type III secretory pathway ATPase